MSDAAAPDVPIRHAATVVLLRDGAAGVEAWLLTRVREMAFAAGMSVFPGGRVDAGDAAVPLTGTSVATVADRYGVDETFARALLAAAARETFEETGVLFTVPAADMADPERARTDVEAGRLAFGELLREMGGAVDGDALHPWSRWITPPGEARRYDTHFFVAGLPAGAHASDVTSESTIAEWVPVATALEQCRHGERGLMPPTFATLSGLLAHATVSDVIAAAPTRDLTPIEPVISRTADGVRATLPDGSTFELPASMLTRRPGPA